ncbi:NUDIX domain-containing protein [Pullulanibacillus sp. KACC 23026]|uniref:NUDIX hydrolase n=1 Tax=Pullulanibacillus sp. KACC 23026 TaxID=3028315 RepID=UPI0023B15618|nr:NUDIX domain-containing protein [Pullulanibacillus sp. KACC 23026]WEG12181.1 NUDIX domain-containing protein [Pullulanibacillus sp. KACC 23026]
MRDRAAVVLIERGKVALIKRVQNGETYYVFPGGGIEAGETPEAAAKREACEELGVEILLKDCLLELEYNGNQYYFLAKITGGVFGSGKGEEFADSHRGSYLPMWVGIDELATLDVKPKEVADRVQELFE